jgi:hypothetical protein
MRLTRLRKQRKIKQDKRARGLCAYQSCQVKTKTYLCKEHRDKINENARMNRAKKGRRWKHNARTI